MNGKTILVVDDDALIIQVVKDILEPQGYKIESAMSGHEALEILNSIKPELMIVDFFLPDMSGRELCVKLRENETFDNIKIVFATGTTFTESGKQELKELNVIDFISKPFHFKELIQKVQSIIG